MQDYCFLCLVCTSFSVSRYNICPIGTALVSEVVADRCCYTLVEQAVWHTDFYLLPVIHN